MHLSAQIVAETCVLQLTRVVHTVSRINKVGVVRWTPQKLHFVVNAKDIADGDVRVWTQMKERLVFGQYSIKSKHKNNEILMKMSFDDLLDALRPAQNARTVTVRLTKKDGGARLTLSLALRQDSATERTAVLDVPVSVLRHDLSKEYQEPALPQPEVSICLPKLKVLRGIIDRMKQLSKHIELSADISGHLTLAVAPDAVKLKLSFEDLDIPDLAEASHNTQRPPDDPVSATIDINKFSQFLFGEQIAPNRVICSIVERRAVILFLLHNDMSLTYYVPVIVS